MEIKSVREILEPVGLNTPLLNVLAPNEENYKTLVLQPSGQIEASTDGVRNKNRELAKKQFGKFLNDVVDTQADLVVTPEYSMPWCVLTNAIKNLLVTSGDIPSEFIDPSFRISVSNIDYFLKTP